MLFGKTLGLLLELLQSINRNFFEDRFLLIWVRGVVIAEWRQDYLLALIIIKLNKELQNSYKIINLAINLS